MYYDKSSDRIRTMLTGTPLTAEKIRVRDEGIKSGYGGTSWFFTMHLIAKSLTRRREEKIEFDSLLTTVRNYQIHDWTQDNNLKRIENRWIDVYNLNIDHFSNYVFEF